MSAPQRILNPMPWYPQADNANRPGGTCGVTSLAMALAALGIVGDGSGRQLEDQLFLEALRRGLDYREADTLRILARWKGCKDTFKTRATWSEIRAHIQAGKPVIVHTWLTRSGHIIPLCGLNDRAYSGKGAYIANDPAGEWANGGYGSNPNGKHVLYSYALMDAVCRADSYDEAMATYRLFLTIPAQKTTLWAHLLDR